MQELKKNNSFTHFKIHTQYSICEGAIKIDNLKDFCKANKVKALGISDSFNLCGALEFSEAISKQGTQTIIGTQIAFKYGDTTGKLTADNSASLYLHIWLHAGSNYSSGSLQTSWGALSQTDRAAGITSFFDSTDREFFITGVQMELGEVATPFEHETFGDNLARCQRYYSKVQYSNWSGKCESGQTYYVHDGFRQTMRANPAASILSQSQAHFPTSRSFGDITTEGVGTGVAASATDNGGYWYTGIALDAEIN